MDACASGLWGQLNDRERREVLAWEAIAVRLDAASDKALEVVRITQDYAGVVRGLSRGTIYRKVAAYREQGVAGVLGAGALRRLGQRGGSALPAAFVAYWRARCAGMQREKVLPVWHALMRELCSGAVVPGYDCDWRGIWLLEHPGATVPSACPYRVDHRAARHPRGWSYRNLKALAPERDVMVGVTRGVAALRAFLPSVPHTRVGLGLMRVVTMDDVWHDVEVLFLHGRKRPEHERPVEVGVMDVLTGCHVCWNLWPVLRREDGSRRMVDKTIQRFIQATILCAIGVHPEGVIELLEHGTAGMDEPEVERLNGILGRYKLPPAQGAWVSVQRSSTTGAPLLQGLFVERACGNPRHKAMLESSWNLLHNALACLPAATGKDRDHAPADAEGLRRADRALMTAVNAVAKANPAALELLRQAEYHAVSFLRFKEVLEGVKREINHRVDHTLEGWEQCGFVRHVATLPGGSELDLDAVEPAQMEATAALVRQLNAPVRLRRLSPMEAFQMAAARMQLVRFPVACAMEILGADLSEVREVSSRGTLAVRDRFSEEVLTYSALASTVEGGRMELKRGQKYRVWSNPFERQGLLVAELDGRAVGVCPLLQATAWGDAEGAQHNLGLWQAAASKQRERLEPLVQPKRAKARETEAKLEHLCAEAVEMQEAVNAERIESLEQWAALSDGGVAPCSDKTADDAVQIEDFLN